MDTDSQLTEGDLVVGEMLSEIPDAVVDGEYPNHPKGPY